MKFTLKLDPQCEEEVIVYAKKPSALADAIKALVSEQPFEWIGYKDREMVRLTTEEIVCFTVEDGKVYALTKNGRFQMRARLYQIEERLPPHFVKLHQSCVANLKRACGIRVPSTIKNSQRKVGCPMKTMYMRQFLQRGLVFGGFGPMVAGLVLWCVSFGVPTVSLTGGEVLVMVISTYLLAFVQAGASVFNQIEEWPLMKSLACHFGSLYVAYAGCYLLNSWIPFEPMVLAIFTAIFVIVYAVIWLTVYLCIKAVSKRCNAKLS